MVDLAAEGILRVARNAIRPVQEVDALLAPLRMLLHVWIAHALLMVVERKHVETLDAIFAVLMEMLVEAAVLVGEGGCQDLSESLVVPVLVIKKLNSIMCVRFTATWCQ